MSIDGGSVISVNACKAYHLIASAGAKATAMTLETNNGDMHENTSETKFGLNAFLEANEII